MIIIVLTLEAFALREKSYWVKTTFIGFIFGLGVMVSFFVGIVIVYQILYADGCSRQLHTAIAI